MLEIPLNARKLDFVELHSSGFLAVLLVAFLKNTRQNHPEGTSGVVGLSNQRKSPARTRPSKSEVLNADLRGFKALKLE